MSMNKYMKYIVANWKMHPQTDIEAKDLFMSMRNVIGRLEDIEMISCPPVIFLPLMKDKIIESVYELGAQDCHTKNEGDFTGKISPLMLKNIGVKYVLLGHSEINEAPEVTAEKISTCLQLDLSPIIVIGEEVRDKRGVWKRDIARSCKILFKKVLKKNLNKVIVAYEPLWAIGKKSKKASAPEDFVKARNIIRKQLMLKFKNEKEVDGVPILYGGSVDDKNVDGFLDFNVDGFLLGRASLDPRIINSIVRIAEQSNNEEYEQNFEELE